MYSSSREFSYFNHYIAVEITVCKVFKNLISAPKKVVRGYMVYGIPTVDTYRDSEKPLHGQRKKKTPLKKQ